MTLFTFFRAYVYEKMPCQPTEEWCEFAKDIIKQAEQLDLQVKNFQELALGCHLEMRTFKRALELVCERVYETDVPQFYYDLAKEEVRNDMP